MMNANEIKSIITEEVQAVLLGQKTSEQAAADMESRLKMCIRDSLYPFQVTFPQKMQTIICIGSVHLSGLFVYKMGVQIYICLLYTSRCV